MKNEEDDPKYMAGQLVFWSIVSGIVLASIAWFDTIESICTFWGLLILAACWIKKVTEKQDIPEPWELPETPKKKKKKPPHSMDKQRANKVRQNLLKRKR